MMAMKIELIHTDQSTVIGEISTTFVKCKLDSLDQR